MIKILPFLKRTLFFNLLFLSGCTLFYPAPDIKVKPETHPNSELIEWKYFPDQLLEEPYFVENLLVFLNEKYSVQLDIIQSQYPDVINALVMNVFFKDLYSNMNIDENEMTKYYNDNINLFRQPPYYELMVVFTTQRRLGLDFLRRLQEGNEISVLLEDKEHEIEKVFAGWYFLQEIPVFLHETVEHLEPGKTSGLIQSGEGYYMVRLFSVQPGRIFPFSKVKAEIHEILVKEEMSRYLLEKFQKR